MSKKAKIVIISVLIILTIPVLFSPPNATMTTEKYLKIQLFSPGEQSNDSTTSNQLIVRISHEDNGPLTIISLEFNNY